jgi:hypothetical protein
LAVGMVLPDVADEAVRITDAVSMLGTADPETPSGPPPDHAAAFGQLFFDLVNMARSFGVEPETALRTRAASFRASVEARG